MAEPIAPDEPLWRYAPMRCPSCSHEWALVTLATETVDHCSQCGYGVTIEMSEQERHERPDTHRRLTMPNDAATVPPCPTCDSPLEEVTPRLWRCPRCGTEATFNPAPPPSDPTNA